MNFPSELSLLFLFTQNDYASIIVDALSNAFHCRVHFDVALNMDQYEKLMNRHPFDIVLVEIKDGCDPLKIREYFNAAYPYIVMVFVCDLTNKQIAFDLLEFGITDVIFIEDVELIPFTVARAMSAAGKEAEKRKLEEELQKTLRSLNEAQKIAQIGSWEYDLEKNQLIWSDELYRMLGIKPGNADLRRGLFLDLLTPEEKDRVNSEIDRGIEEKNGFSVEFSMYGMDGVFRTVRSDGRAVRNTGGECVMMRGIMQDITAQKEAEAALNRNLYLLRAIMEGADDPILIKDEEGKILLANTAAVRAMNAPGLEMLYEKGQAYFIGDEYYNDIIKIEKRIMAADKPEQVEVLLPSKKGLRTYLSNKSPWHDETGSVTGIIIVSRDITERKEMELKLKTQAEKLDAKNRQILNYIINITHDFKTPISILIFSLEMVESIIEKNEELREELKEYIEILKQNAFRISKLVGNFLDINLIESGFLQPAFIHIDIVNLLYRFYYILKPFAKRKKVRLKFETAIKIKIFKTDIYFLERIVMSLVSNALKHTSKGNFLHIFFNDQGKTVVISVKDNGKSISQKSKDIFNNGTKPEKNIFAYPKEDYPIELIIAKDFTQILGGQIRYAEPVSGGNEFFIELPMLKADESKQFDHFNSMDMYRRMQIEFSDVL